MTTEEAPFSSQFTYAPPLDLPHSTATAFAHSLTSPKQSQSKQKQEDEQIESDFAKAVEQMKKSVYSLSETQRKAMAQKYGVLLQL